MYIEHSSLARSPLLLELLDEALDGGPREGLGLAALAVVHQRVHDRRSRVRRRRHLASAANLLNILERER